MNGRVRSSGGAGPPEEDAILGRTALSSSFFPFLTEQKKSGSVSMTERVCKKEIDKREDTLHIVLPMSGRSAGAQLAISPLIH